MKFLILLLITALSGCAQLTPLPEPTKTQTAELSKFKFLVIPRENKITSASGGVIKELSPDDYIEGLLLKRGLVRLYNKAPESATKENTLAVKFAVSGQRAVILGIGGYTMEVTIALLSAKTMEPIYTCTAEGMGGTEVDDLRIAIKRCLAGAK